MGGQFEAKDGATKKYYSIAGMMVATQDASGLQYLLTDHLGSTVGVTNSSGTLTSQQRYLPFGAARTIPNSPITSTDFTYTGQRKLDDGMGGVMDYKARFYSPYINRFLQPDSIIPDQFNPQSWNRYSYVSNNPIRYNDPTGHCIWDLCIVEGIGLVELVIALAAITASTYVIQNHDRMVEGIESGIESITYVEERWQQDNSGWKQREYMESISGKTADDGLMASPDFEPSNCGFGCILLLVPVVATLACVLMFAEKCTQAVSPSTPVVTPTTTATPDCQPLTNCYPPELIIGPKPLTVTPTPPASATSTVTSTPTITVPTQTSTAPVITPNPNYQRLHIPI